MGANGSQNISVIHIFIYLTIYLYSNLSLLDLHVSYNKTITMFSVRKLIKQKLKLPFKTPTEWLRCYQTIFVGFPVLDLVQS